MKMKTPTRPNFSRYAKLCDQTFYHDSAPVYHAPPSSSQPSPTPNTKQLQPTQSTYGFTSISREKKGNFRFAVRLPKGQFSHYPNHCYGRERSPSWSFSRRERYGKEEIVEYEVCEKNPLLHDHQQLRTRATTYSGKAAQADKMKSMRTTAYLSQRKDQEMRETSVSHNYSIIAPQGTSAVHFFNPSKIQRPRYLSKQDLKRVQSSMDEANYQRRAQPLTKGYVEFPQRRPRAPNNNSKGFETLLQSYNHERQFDNYTLNKYPTHPDGQIDMEKQLDRPDYTPDKLGPNTTPFQIDFTHQAANKINLLLSTFRDRITTRFDRVGAEPNTRLDYDARPPTPPGLVQMDRDIGRNPELFPIVDPAIKKAGDTVMKEELRKSIPLKEINEAMRPKNVENYTQLVAEGL